MLLIALIGCLTVAHARDTNAYDGCDGGCARGDAYDELIAAMTLEDISGYRATCVLPRGTDLDWFLWVHATTLETYIFDVKSNRLEPSLHSDVETRFEEFMTEFITVGDIGYDFDFEVARQAKFEDFPFDAALTALRRYRAELEDETHKLCTAMILRKQILAKYKALGYDIPDDSHGGTQVLCHKLLYERH